MQEEPRFFLVLSPLYTEKAIFKLPPMKSQMDCPYCSHKESKVTDKRESPEGIRRRRECLKCAKRFTTYEKAVLEDIYVIKKDNRRERFNREKLERICRNAGLISYIEPLTDIAYWCEAQK